MAQKPTAHRVFSILVAVLLVTSMVASIAAARPVAAQDGTGDCMYGSVNWWIFSCATTSYDEIPNDSGAYLQSDAYASAMTVRDDQRSTNVRIDNYLEDSPTLASLDAKNAIADSWEAGENRSQAETNVNQTINDYYAIRETNLLEEYSAQSAHLAYLSSQTINDPDSENDFFHPGGFGLEDGSQNYTYAEVSGSTSNQTYTLVNGSTLQYQAPKLKYDSSNGWTQTNAFPLSSYDPAKERFAIMVGSGSHAEWEGRVQTLNVPEFDLPSAEVYSHREVAIRLNEIEQQRQTAHTNFDPQFIDGMYTALDNGNITPEQLRSAEGMVRHLSGNASVSEERFKIATHAVLGLAQPDLNMTMKVHYEGPTNFHYETENGTRIANYTDEVNATYEGLLFSSEVPTNGFQINETYDTGALNGSQMIVTQNDTVHFYNGSMTIEAMYDSAGNAVDNQTWSQPKYQTYDSAELVALLEQVAEDQQELQERDDGSDGGTSIGDAISDLFSGGNGAIGLVAVGVVATLFVVGKLSN